MNWRCKVVSLWTIGLLGVLCTLLLYPPKDAFGAREASNIISVAIENEMASADIRGGTVAKIIRILEEECGVRFYADQSILDEVIYVQFSNLPLHAGMMKIFSGMNLILYFLPNGNLVEVALLGKKGIQPAQATFPGVKGIQEAPASETNAEDERPLYRSDRGLRRGPPPPQTKPVETPKTSPDYRSWAAKASS